MMTQQAYKRVFSLDSFTYGLRVAHIREVFIDWESLSLIGTRCTVAINPRRTRVFSDFVAMTPTYGILYRIPQKESFHLWGTYFSK